MTKYLIAIDLDGTALYDMYTMTSITVVTLEKVKALGHEVVISTGRAFESTEHFYHKLKLKTPLINYNGGLVTLPVDDSFIQRTNFIPLDIIIDILKNNSDIIDNYIIKNNQEIYIKNEDQYTKKLNIKNAIQGEIEGNLNTNPNGFSVILKPDTHEILNTYIENNYFDKISFRALKEYDKIICEINSKVSDKGDALLYVANYLNIDIKNVIAFGDADNDVGMIKVAGIGIAMENACDEVKEVADDFAMHHQKDGVAHYLIKFFNL